MAEIEIRDESKSTRVGSIVFDENPVGLDAVCTAAGFNITIPATVQLKSSPQNSPRLTVRNINAILSTRDEIFMGVEVGRVRHDRFYSAFVSPTDTTEVPRPANLTWSSNYQSLLFIEQARAGENPKLHFRIDCELSYVVICEQWQDHVRTARARFPVLTEPQSVYGEVDVTYRKEIWEDMLKRLIAGTQPDPFLLMLPLKQFLSGRKT